MLAYIKPRNVGRHIKLHNCLCINAGSSTFTFQINEAPISNYKKWMNLVYSIEALPDYDN